MPVLLVVLELPALGALGLAFLEGALLLVVVEAWVVVEDMGSSQVAQNRQHWPSSEIPLVFSASPATSLLLPVRQVVD